jgi:cellulose synthase/poly-beta-1,6-N-acetylglucosamine synthase-like glycosyltransferase
MSHGDVYMVLITCYAVIQVAYLLAMAVNGYFYSRWVDWIEHEEVAAERTTYPPILLLYPVLHEAEETMRTTMLSIAAAQAAYQPGHARVVAIPNANDTATIASLDRLVAEFDFLEILPVPPTNDPAWAPVWSNWDMNSKAYWWHVGKRRAEMQLPPKKTRQLIYALYTMADGLQGDGWLLSYLDADSAVPVDYYRIAAAGADHYDVVQLTNVAGNLLDTWASSFHSMDHMAWDGGLYPHMSAHGKHPFYVLGKGLFFKVSDLLELGGFNPWLTIEDPEVGMRLWTNGRTLGVSNEPLIEEVPRTFGGGITQRKRWVAGFFQSLHVPLSLMGMSFGQRMRARLNLVPCLSLIINAVGLPLGVWAIVESALGRDPVDVPLTVLSIVNIVIAVALLVRIFVAAWSRSKMVLDSRRSRAGFLLRVNPVFLLTYWILWMVPLAIGIGMFLADRGLEWQRTEKTDANHDLVRTLEAIELDQPVHSRNGADPSGARDVIVLDEPELLDSSETGGDRSAAER